MNEEFKKRVLSFLWAGFAMGLAYALEYLAENLGIFNLSTEIVTIIGLIIAQITKALRNTIVK
ncbi:MAG: hypothetical protein PHQ01_02700 [Candidatus Pacebacteria bacterium]|jgi:hypothetical protein|nr:hypothetical protein [Candidatus Paceibacterota bacterium]